MSEEFNLAAYRAQRENPVAVAEEPAAEKASEAEVTKTDTVEPVEPEPKPDEKKHKEDANARFSKLTAEKRELETRVKALEEAAKKPETEKVEEKFTYSVARPSAGDFDNLDDWNEAMGNWVVDKRQAEADWKKNLVKAEAEKGKREAEHVKAEELKAKRNETVKAALDKGRSAHPDFDKVALNPEVPVSDVAAEFMFESELGYEILYKLGSDKAEAKRISELPKYKQVKELLSLEESLKNDDDGEQGSKAPEPVKPVKAKAEKIPNLDKMTLAEYRKLRESGKL